LSLKTNEVSSDARSKSFAVQ